MTAQRPCANGKDLPSKKNTKTGPRFNVSAVTIEIPTLVFVTTEMHSPKYPEPAAAESENAFDQHLRGLGCVHDVGLREVQGYTPACTSRGNVSQPQVRFN
jgi:hypothetical protein